jgi:MarR family transcriptional regulator, organic hydroperoxide resistance regulator
VDRDQAARQVTEAVTRLFFSVENQARFHGASDELGISPPMLKALLELSPREATPMRELAERWGCDASFVTVTCDGLEARGLIERRVAEHDRRIKMVELTPAGVDALTRAGQEVYGPRAGFAALTADEQRTLARLLTKLADAQATHDETFLDQPGVRATARRMAAQRTREVRARGGDRGAEGWREHLAVHREEIRRLKEEIARVSAEVKVQARRPVDEAREVTAEVKAAKDEVKAAKAEVKAEAKAAKSKVKAEVKAARDDVLDHLKGERRRR